MVHSIAHFTASSKLLLPSLKFWRIDIDKDFGIDIDKDFGIDIDKDF
jgi:hypothetical protein